MQQFQNQSKSIHSEDFYRILISNTQHAGMNLQSNNAKSVVSLDFASNIFVICLQFQSFDKN